MNPVQYRSDRCATGSDALEVCCLATTEVVRDPIIKIVSAMPKRAVVFIATPSWNGERDEMNSEGQERLSSVRKVTKSMGQVNN